MLKNKVIYITGAAGLIGSKFTQSCLEQGARVACADINPKVLDELELEIPEAYRDRFFKTCMNITDRESIENSLRSVREKFSKIDVLVNNAYPRNKNYGKKFFEVEYQDFCENLGMNLGGYFLTSQVFAKYFKEQGEGNIINVSSIYGVIAPRFEVYHGTEMTMPIEYAAIKSALIHMSKYMSKYFKGTGIRVNCLSPGGVFDGQNEQFVESYNSHCMNRGMVMPEDLCGTLHFLCSDMSKWVNGQNIIIDDGFVL